jgi:antirestriction protein ArdC
MPPAKAARSSEAPTRTSLYDTITQQIIAQLEAGHFPWVRPWKSAGDGQGLPYNATTGRPYSGINILLLWSAIMERGFVRPAWLTYRQAQAVGGQVRKGERGTMVVFAKRFTPDAEKERAAANDEDPRSIPFLRSYTVFNIDQCEGLPPEMRATRGDIAEAAIEPDVKAIIAASGVPFRIGGDAAYYAPSGDYVVVPTPEAFHAPIDWHRTALHELGHATGHPTRLNRDMTGGFGSEAYAREELVAEMCAAFCCATLGIQPTVRHADYLASWLDVVKSDNRAIIKAASQASKAADWILALRPASVQTLIAEEDGPTRVQPAEPECLLLADYASA